MAKDQFKTKQKVVSLTSRFNVVPLVDKGAGFLCVDANFNFLMVQKQQLEKYTDMALPETYQDDLNKKAMKEALAHLPGDSKKVDRLKFHLKTNGIDGFEDELTKQMAS